jgi:DNA-binding HxlR family transcriptional regulator
LERPEEAGIVERRFYEQHPPRAEYLLTEKGKELRPVLKILSTGASATRITAALYNPRPVTLRTRGNPGTIVTVR